MKKRSKADKICNTGTAIFIGLFAVYMVLNLVIMKGGF